MVQRAHTAVTVQRAHSGECAAGARSGECAASARSGDGAAGGRSGDGAAGAHSGDGAAIEIGRNDVWETIFVVDSAIKYVDSSFCRKDHKRRIMCSFDGAGVRNIKRTVNNIISGYGRKKLVVVHRGVNDEGKAYSDVLKNRQNIGKAAESKGL